MKHLSIGIFHNEDLGNQLGKKGTESDILMFNRKTDNSIFNFMIPFNDKLTTKTQIISTIDYAIIYIEKLTSSIGETIMLIDSLNITNGLIVIPEYTDTTQIKKIIENTNLQKFEIIEMKIPMIMEKLENIKIKNDNSKPPVVVVDHSFNVKGIGEIILGVVKQGIIHKHDKMILLPAEKEVTIRSIQIQDKNYDEAEAGCRVGLAIKGAVVDEMKRGSIFTTKENAKISKSFKLKINKNPYYPEIKKGVFHATIGMQNTPVNIIFISDDIIEIETNKKISYTGNDFFILLDLNAEKLHHIGTGKIIN